MSDSHPQGFETRDVDVGNLVKFVVWLGISLVGISVMTWFIFNWLRVSQIAAKRSDYQLTPGSQLPPEPRLDGIVPGTKPVPTIDNEKVEQAMKRWLAAWKGSRQPPPPEFRALPTDATSGRFPNRGEP